MFTFSQGLAWLPVAFGIRLRARRWRACEGHKAGPAAFPDGKRQTPRVSIRNRSPNLATLSFWFPFQNTHLFGVSESHFENPMDLVQDLGCPNPMLRAPLSSEEAGLVTQRASSPTRVALQAGENHAQRAQRVSQPCSHSPALKAVSASCPAWPSDHTQALLGDLGSGSPKDTILPKTAPFLGIALKVGIDVFGGGEHHTAFFWSDAFPGVLNP